MKDLGVKKPASAGIKAPLVLLSAAIALFAAAGATAWIGSGEPVDAQSDCLAEGTAPAVQVIAIDTSDKLIETQRASIEREVLTGIAAMNPHERLVMVEVSGQSSFEAMFLDVCIPAQNSNRSRRRMKNQVTDRVPQVLDQLDEHSTSAQTPIIETIAALADRPDLRDRDGRLVVLLLTDGLQHSGLADFYDEEVALGLRADLLAGVTIRIVPLRNTRDQHLQGAALDTLVNALTDLEAVVELEKPGWLVLLDA